MLSALAQSLKTTATASTTNCLLRMSSTTAYKTLSVTVPKEFVYHVKLNRPDKFNAINKPMWYEIKKCFEELSDDENCRSIVISGEGKVFSSGIDLSCLMEMGSLISGEKDIARKAKDLLNIIKSFQECFTALELCKKPVLAAVHSLCIGAGVDLISGADIRYCSKDAVFQVKEVDVGLAADVGTLQRLPKIIGSDSLARELCYTARKMHADEALSCGLVSRVFNSKDDMIDEVIKVADTIAKKSPVAVQGTKRSIVFSRDHSVQEGLEHIAMWNQIMLQSEDVVKAAASAMSKDENIRFSKL